MQPTDGISHRVRISPTGRPLPGQASPKILVTLWRRQLVRDASYKRIAPLRCRIRPVKAKAMPWNGLISPTGTQRPTMITP